MKIREMTYRVPYADTDKMGVVYYANYFEYFERSRTEFLREAGLPYGELERCGIFLPVSEAYCKYRASAHYDDLLILRSWVEELKGVRIKICSEVVRDGIVLASGYVMLACVNAAGKLIKPPPELEAVCR